MTKPAIPADSPRKALRRQPLNTYDLDLLGRLDSVNAPKQARSEQSLQRVLASLELLLQDKAFKDISIPDISLHAKCSAATIYARFRDKDSILAALHESLRDRHMGEVDARLNPAHWKGKTLRELTLNYSQHLLDYYASNHFLLVAILKLDDAGVKQRVAITLQHVAQRMSQSLVVILGRELPLSQVDLAIRSVFALVQQKTLFSPVSLRRDNADEWLSSAEECALVMQMCLNAQDDQVQAMRQRDTSTGQAPT